MSVNQQVVDRYVEYRAWLIRYENRVVVDVLESMAAGEERAIGAIMAAYEDAETLGVPFTAKGVQTQRRVLRRVRESVADVFPAARKSLRESLELLANDTQAEFVATLEEALPPFAIDEMELSRVPERQIANILDAQFGANVPTGTSVAKVLDLDGLAELERRVVDAAQRTIVEGLRDGTGTRALIGRVREVVGVGRGNNRNTRLAREIATYVRTAVQQTANDVAGQVYRENDDVVKGEQYVATLDDATCPVCGPLDGTTWYFKDKEQPPRPPRHPNCRCFMAPIVKSWEEMGLPSSMPEAAKRALSGQPAKRTTWSDWVQRNPKRLERVLGPSRAELVQSGGLSLGDLATTREVLTLDELADKMGRGRVAA